MRRSCRGAALFISQGGKADAKTTQEGAVTMTRRVNWAGNYEYGAKDVLTPDSLEALQEAVARHSRVKALGTRHSFNGLADTEGCQLSTERLRRVLKLDGERRKVTVEAGIRYGELCGFLHEHGFALHNLASLPHISVGGACATATHGSGDRNGNLATAVHSVKLVRADGETAVFTRGDEGYGGAVVSLGGLGVVAELTLDIVPAFRMSQYVYEALPVDALEQHLDAIFSSAYSVSLFTNWKDRKIQQVWQKRVLQDGRPDQAEPDFFGASPASAKVHPVQDLPAENCSEQLGVPGAWHERLPHFRMEFTPSAGKELQSEYFVPRRDACRAMQALEPLYDRISPLLYISEIRSIAADELWMSPNYKQDSVGIHFTWKADWEAVRQLLPLIEGRLAPFGVRPHWAKLFTLPPSRLQPLYEKFGDFRGLALQLDPGGKFRNRYMDQLLDTEE